MPEWVTHMMVADRVLEDFPQLDRHGFYVGNVAPDCNIQNEDWTAFTPSREVTHWMKGRRKTVSDVDSFCEEYILKRREEIFARGEQRVYTQECVPQSGGDESGKLGEEYSFLLGYYVHLITDAVFQEMIRDEVRVAAAWARIKADEELMEQVAWLNGQRTGKNCLQNAEDKMAQNAEERTAQNETMRVDIPSEDSEGESLPENWDTVKRLIPREERLREFRSLEAEYLKEHPDCGYFTDIMPLQEFPDYIDYLPHGCIAFKIPYLGSYIPEIYEEAKFIGWSREEFKAFLEKTIRLVATKFKEYKLI